jgi:hypothetical protein
MTYVKVLAGIGVLGIVLVCFVTIRNLRDQQAALRDEIKVYCSFASADHRLCEPRP